MSRERFIPPTSQTDISAAISGVTINRSQGVNYTCGNCAERVTLGKGEPVRCKDCGSRILYKERTRRVSK